MRYMLLLLLLLPINAWAQTPEQPQVTAELPEGDVIVGQPAIVRIKVLVPTFMPSSPVFPSLEQENLLVRLPERASGPISENVDGETWSGVQRSYRLYPLQAGKIDLGVPEIVVTFADPETNEPTQVEVPLPALELNAVVPKAAQGLDPLIIATGFEVDHQIEGETDMQSGSAITRRLTARISGTTPLLIPKLIPQLPDPLLRAYPKEPRFSETEDRGVLSGQRVDEVVYLAQDGGETQLPPVSIKWYNLESEKVETIDISAVDLTLAPPKWEPPDAETILQIAFQLLLLAIAVWVVFRSFRPRISYWLRSRRIRYQTSGAFALEQLKHALKSNDLSAAYAALGMWKTRSQTPDDAARLEQRLAQIGAARYSAHPAPQREDWAAALSELKSLGQKLPVRAKALPPLNP